MAATQDNAIFPTGVLLFGMAFMMVVEAIVLGLLLGGAPSTAVELGLATVLQFALFLVVIGVAIRVSGRRPQSALAMRRSSVRFVGLAIVLGAIVGVAPLWLSARIVVAWPESQPEALGAMTDVLSGGGPVWILLFGVLLLGPVVEELIFRGALWSLLADVVSPTTLLLLTSCLFALYHFAPLHVLSVLPIALILGVLRQTSGSIWPPIVAHVVNNVSAVLLLDAAPASSLLASGCLVATCVLTWLCFRVVEPSP